MNCLVISFSKFGNTRQVAETIAGALQSTGAPGQVSVRLIEAQDLPATSLGQIDLLVMGAPTHNMNLPKPLRPILAALPRKALKGLRFAAFDTSYELSGWLKPFTAGKRLSKKLRKLGGTQMVPPEIFTVMGREGPLHPGELERAARWGTTILAACGMALPEAIAG